MSSSLRVNTIVPSTGTNVAIGTANGTVTFTDSVNFVLGTGSSIFSPASNTLTFGTNDAERLRIDSTGRIGINQTSPEAMLQVDYDYANSEVGLRLRAASGSGTKTWQLSEINGNAGVFTIRNATNSQDILSIDGVNQRVGVNNTSPDHKVSVYDAGYCGLELKSNRSTATDNIGGLHFKTQSTNVAYIQSLVDGTINFRNTSSLTERLRITSDGKMGLGTNSPGSYDGEADNFVVASSDHTGITIASTGSSKRTNLYFADGTSGNERYRGAITYDHNDDYMMMRTTGTERVRILGSGFVNIGSGYLTNSNSGLHVGRSSGGTAAGESVIAATLGDSSSMVNALLSVKNAGNRGSQGHSSGSSLAKFEFNNGTAFEVDKYGRRTLPYQPAFFVYKNQSAWSLAANAVFVFDTAELNVGGHYSTSNGRFTAPITARYVFHFFSIYTGNATGDSIEMYKNGSRMYGGDVHFTNDVGSNWDTVHYSRVIQLSSGDYVHMQTRTGHTFHGNHWGGWSGYMLG